MNLTEGNKLIAEFMGMKFQHTSIDSHNFEQYSYVLPDSLSIQVYGYVNATAFLDEQFSTSWDWLMPVVHKIESLGFDSRINGNDSDGGFFCDFVDYENNEFASNTSYLCKIDAVYGAVVDFIKYYSNK